MYAFLWKYVKLYNRQTINELKDKLFFCIVFPTVDKIHKDMRLLFHCEIASMFRCGTETLKNKFAEINMNDKKEDGRRSRLFLFTIQLTNYRPIYNPTYNNLRARCKVYVQYYLCKMDICAYLFDFLLCEIA